MKALEPRIMYIERKAGALTGEARIGRVTFSKTGKTIYYQGQIFQSVKRQLLKSSYINILSEEDYWISSPKKDGTDRIYSERVPVFIDDNVRVEYWTLIRRLPDQVENNIA